MADGKLSSYTSVFPGGDATGHLLFVLFSVTSTPHLAVYNSLFWYSRFFS